MKTETPTRSSLKGPVAVFLFLSLPIGIAGYFHLAHQLAVSRQRAQEELAAIADLKAGQIANWYRERRADAEIILMTPAIQSQARQFLSTAVPAAAGRDFLAWMESLRQLSGYTRVVLYDARGSPRVSALSNATPPNVSHDPDFQTALRTKGVVMTDLHRDQDAAYAGQQPIHLSIWVPIEIKPGAETPADGAWLLQIDPYQFLYPLIQSWPTPSRTAETLLVRREGNDVVYLNELRHRANTALSLRFPIDRQRHLPAVVAALGQEGVIEGRDYRDVPVLAATRTVRGTPWFIVAKVDREEIYAPLRERAWSIGITLLISILAAALSVRWMVSQRDAQQLQVQLDSERERQALAQRILHLNKHANDIILLADQHWRILEANDRALQAYGYSLEELQLMRLSELRVPETRAEFDRLIDQLEAQDGAMVETVHQRKDGSKFPVESSIRSVETGEEKYRQSIIRDITERKQAEEKVQTLLAAVQQERDRLSALVNSITDEVWFTDTQKRFTLANPAALREFRLADGSSIEVEELARSLEVLRPDGSPRPVEEAPPLRALAGEVVRNQEEIIRTPVGGELRHRQVSSSPVRDAAGSVIGAVSVVRDITEIKRAEEAQRMSETRYRSLFDNMVEGFAYCRMLFEDGRPQDFIYLDVNEAFQIQTGLRNVIGRKASEVIPGILGSDPELLERYGRVALTGNPERFETYLAALKMWFSISVYCPEKEHFVAVFDVITERKQAQEALRESERRYRDMLGKLELISIMLDRDARVTFCNDYLLRLTGWRREEVLGSDWFELFIPPGDDKLKGLFDALLDNQPDAWHHENEILTRSGERRLIHWSNSVLCSTSGEVIGTACIGEDITERKRADLALRRSHKQLRALFVRLQGVREEERTRIAGEIHDELGQLLTGLKMDLRWMERRVEELSADPQMNPILDKIVAATELADATIKTVQRIAAELRPGILDRLGLLTALRYESNQFQHRMGIVCRLQAPEEEPRLAPATATAFFRIFQEALTNIARHSGASAVEAAFRLENEQFLLEVRDNGKGITEAALSNSNSLGLLSMHERARALAGEVAIRRAPEGGTIVTARIPQAANQAENI